MFFEFWFAYPGMLFYNPSCASSAVFEPYMNPIGPLIPSQLFTISLFEMKVLLAISTLMAVANAMPTQYVLVPLNQLHYLQPQYHHRVARSAWPQDGGPPGGPGAFVIPADIRATEDNLSAGR